MYFRYYNRRKFISDGAYPEDCSADFSEDFPKEYIAEYCPSEYIGKDGTTYHFRYLLTVHVISQADYEARNKYSVPLQEFTLRDIYSDKIEKWDNE